MDPNLERNREGDPVTHSPGEAPGAIPPGVPSTTQARTARKTARRNANDRENRSRHGSTRLQQRAHPNRGRRLGLGPDPATRRMEGARTTVPSFRDEGGPRPGQGRARAHAPPEGSAPARQPGDKRHLRALVDDQGRGGGRRNVPRRTPSGSPVAGLPKAGPAPARGTDPGAPPWRRDRGLGGARVQTLREQGTRCARWGKYGYYWQCRACQKNTPMPTECRSCGAKGHRGREVRIRKDGPTYFRDCQRCGNSELVWTAT